MRGYPHFHRGGPKYSTTPSETQLAPLRRSSPVPRQRGANGRIGQQSADDEFANRRVASPHCSVKRTNSGPAIDDGSGEQWYSSGCGRSRTGMGFSVALPREQVPPFSRRKTTPRIFERNRSDKGFVYPNSTPTPPSQDQRKPTDPRNFLQPEHAQNLPTPSPLNVNPNPDPKSTHPPNTRNPAL